MFFSFDRLFYLLSLSNIWILASRAAHSTEQAWLWLCKLGDLWRRLIALCCVWDSVALRRPTKITILSLPSFPALNPASGSSRETVRPLLPLSVCFCHQRGTIKNHKVMELLWLQEDFDCSVCSKVAQLWRLGSTHDLYALKIDGFLHQTFWQILKQKWKIIPKLEKTQFSWFYCWINWTLMIFWDCPHRKDSISLLVKHIHVFVIFYTVLVSDVHFKHGQSSKT